MKILILSCHTGQGHDSASNAIRREAEKLGHSCRVEDALAFISPRLSRFLSWGHVWMYRNLPGLFRWGYAFAEKHPGLLEPKGLLHRGLSRGSKGLTEFIRDGGYDAILCSHVFSAVLLTEVLRHYDYPGKTAFLATDYTCSPGVSSIELDQWIIPHESLREEFVSKGVPSDRILPMGIPVREEFNGRTDRREAKKALGIPEDHSHIVMMCGSMGCGPMAELGRLLADKMNDHGDLTIVCGSNRTLADCLQDELGDRSNVHVRGFVKNVSEIMDSADLYLTKPGGLSTTEAAAKGLPMVLVDAVAGCEEYNLRFFTRLGGAVTASTPEELSECCLKLLSQPERLRLMEKNLLRAQLGFGARKIAGWAVSDTKHLPRKTAHRLTHRPLHRAA